MIFIKYHIYNFSDCIGKTFYSNLYQCFLISILFFWVCKLASILSFTKLQLAFTFFPMSMSGIFRKSFLFGLQKGRGKTEKMCCGFFNTLLSKANSCSYLQHVYQRPFSFCYNVLNWFLYFWKLNWYYHFARYLIITDRCIIQISVSIIFYVIKIFVFGIFHNSDYFLYFL